MGVHLLDGGNPGNCGQDAPLEKAVHVADWPAMARTSTSRCTTQSERRDFLHQEAVDSYAAQHAGPPTKPVTVWFALVGLHLFVDRGRTGRQVQQAHMRLARFGTTWDAIEIPSIRTA
jgi:hypothetical protein